MTTCMTPFVAAVAPDAMVSWRHAQALAAAGKIDPVQHLARQRVYAFSGASDATVKTIVVDQVSKYYLLAGAAPPQIAYVRNPQAGHAFITDDPDDQACEATRSPYINNCGIRQAQDLLRHLYPERTAPAGTVPAGQLIRFDQRAFVRDPRSSMDDDAWLYVPDACRAGGCAVHVAFHGCRQGASAIGDRFYRGAGYNGWADANRVLVLYPQVHRSDGIPANPLGCWDFWGYTNGANRSDTFVTRAAPQMAAVMAMVERLGQQP
jgi:hypothetical protein